MTKQIKPLRKKKAQQLGLGLTLASALFITGCKSELYSNLQERDVNEMISVLSNAGIEATRSDDGKGGFGLSVDRSQFSAAIGTLSEKGLPRENFGSLGKVFNSDKLVSTPFEERARFMHALNQELSNSITRIDGVASARVHIMVPETSPFEKLKTPPRASVFIYQQPGAELKSSIPVIKNLIVNSLDDLEYSFVEVALFDANVSNTDGRSSAIGIPGGEMVWNFMVLVGLGIAAWFAFKLSGSGKQNKLVTRQTSASSNGSKTQ